MNGARRVRALLAGAAVAGGLAMAAPSGVLADTGTGCQGTYSLAAGQTAQCSFVYSGPGSDGEFSDFAGVSVLGGPTVVQVRLQTAVTDVLDHCEAVSAGFGGCGTSTGRNEAPEAPGTVVFCVVENLGPNPASGRFSCSSGS